MLSFAKPATGPLLFLTILLTPSSTEEAWVDTWSKIAEDSFCQSAEEAAWQAQFVSGVIMPLMTFIGNLGYVIIAVIGGIFVT